MLLRKVSLQLWLLALVVGSGCRAEGARDPFEVEDKAEGLRCPEDPGLREAPEAYRYLEQDLFVDLPPTHRPLYIVGDVQGGAQAWMAAMIAAGLTEVRDLDAGGQLLSPVEALLQGDLDQRRMQRLRIRWTGKDALVVQVGDLIHGGRYQANTTDNLGVLRYALALEEAIAEAGTEGKLVLLIGNHDYAFLTSPQEKSFPQLRDLFAQGERSRLDDDVARLIDAAGGLEGEAEARVQRGLCRGLFPNASFFGRRLRSLALALRVNRVFVSHTGFIGVPELSDEGRCSSPNSATSPLDAYVARGAAALSGLPRPDPFLVDHLPPSPAHDPLRPQRADRGGVLGEANWWERPSWPSPAARSGPENERFSWAEYFEALGAEAIVFGHSSRPFSDKDWEKTRALSYAPSQGNSSSDTYRLYKTDVSLYDRKRQLLQQGASWNSEADWILRCVDWVAAAEPNRSPSEAANLSPGEQESSLRCPAFERMTIDAQGQAHWQPVEAFRP